MTTAPKHGFVVGETYRDRLGSYKVVSIEGKQVVYEYPDGVQREGDAETKWRIHQNTVSEPIRSHRGDDSAPSGSGGSFFTHAEAFPIIAGAIEAYGKKHAGYLEHDKLVRVLMSDPEAQAILERRPDKTKAWAAGVMVAWFSKVFTDGRSDWDSRFERKKIGSAWAYRVRRGKPRSSA